MARATTLFKQSCPVYYPRGTGDLDLRQLAGLPARASDLNVQQPFSALMDRHPRIAHGQRRGTTEHVFRRRRVSRDRGRPSL